MNPLGMSEAEAALYIGVGKTKFRELVEAGDMPKPRKIGRRRLWARIELDSAFLELPTDTPANSWDDLLNDDAA